MSKERRPFYKSGHTIVNFGNKEEIHCDTSEALVRVLCEYARNTDLNFNDVTNLIKPCGLTVSAIVGAVRSAQKQLDADMCGVTRRGEFYAIRV